MKQGVRLAYLVGFVALVIAIIIPMAVRWAAGPSGPMITVIDAIGEEQHVTLRHIQQLAVLCRRSSYENQFGNWRDEGEYCGVLLTELLNEGSEYTAISVVAEDGYHVEIDRTRIEDLEYPVVLAFSLDGVIVPDWTDGYRIAVLPEDGGVSNADYETDSAGSYWIKNVARIELLP